MSTEHSPLPPDARIIDGVSYIPSSALLSGARKLTFKDDLSFGVMNLRGEAPRATALGSELGIFHADTRMLSVWELLINGTSPVSLSQEMRAQGRAWVISMTNRDFEIGEVGAKTRVPRESLLIRRLIVLEKDNWIESLSFRNFHPQAVALEIENWFGSSFEDIFEVRGFRRERRGTALAPRESREGSETETVLRYEGLDHRERSTWIRKYYRAETIQLTSQLGGHRYRFVLEPNAERSLNSQISFGRAPPPEVYGLPVAQLSQAQIAATLSRAAEAHPFRGKTRIDCDNQILARAVDQASVDIAMLLTEEAPGNWFPHAGIPWFSAPFGRDGIITAYQLLPFFPEIARGVLDFVFAHLGTQVDPFTEEEPGKVFHELRRGEVCATRELPFSPYYGSIDSTPLALILLHEYFLWTEDHERLRGWWPDVVRAAQWMEKFGDADQDGFLEYQCHSERGLSNQGWKDSHNSVMHRDGSLASSPIRLCEVQGYAFRAWNHLSELARIVGDDRRAEHWQVKARSLQKQFHESFWDSESGAISLALDGNHQPCRVRSSNMGQCLWGRIVAPELAPQIASTLLSEKLFSGYGIRTLASDEVAYNPLSYHNGSIWPHDNAMILEGFRHYGLRGALDQGATALLDVLESHRDLRLPELFCGFRRRENEPPVPYEVACRPQAWAAGAVFQVLRSLLGISAELGQNYLVIQTPILPARTQELRIDRLRFRNEEMDLVFQRTQAGVQTTSPRKTPGARFLQVRSRG